MNKKVLLIGLAVCLCIAATTYAVSRLCCGNPYKAETGGGIASGYGGCRCSGQNRGSASGTVSEPRQEENSVQEAKRRALDYYVNKYGNDRVAVDIKDFGCHLEAYVAKDGKMLKKLSINGDSIFEVK